MLRRRASAPPIFRLTDDIAIGPAPDTRTIEALHHAGFRVIVDLRAGAGDSSDTATRYGLSYRHLPVSDGEAPNIEELKELTIWVCTHVAETGPVFLHCREGRGRSATVAAACLVRLGLPLTEAYRLLMQARPDALLSANQTDALEAFAAAVQARAA